MLYLFAQPPSPTLSFLSFGFQQGADAGSYYATFGLSFLGSLDCCRVTCGERVKRGYAGHDLAKGCQAAPGGLDMPCTSNLHISGTAIPAGLWRILTTGWTTANSNHRAERTDWKNTTTALPRAHTRPLTMRQSHLLELPMLAHRGSRRSARSDSGCSYLPRIQRSIYARR